MIDLKTVQYVADLARVRLSEKEAKTFTEQLAKILTYFESLKEINTDTIEPTSHVLPLKNVFRQDLLKKSLPQDEVLAIAPKKKGSFVKVLRVIETG
ncbi:MAG: Asp-tRNA(Asn)/Glu-tRNA(Gln) amidotransferase subunit GatC [Candidatus Omnitrophica bacterium]|nr:Asp-tRNA(Asn)/Glu-tRNA(Gln) amidotransferase subunit GatC [Candidatus Omnitrophota bacterium]